MTERNPPGVTPPAGPVIGRRALLAGGLGALAAGVVAGIRPADAAARGTLSISVPAPLNIQGNVPGNEGFGLLVNSPVPGVGAIVGPGNVTDTLLEVLGNREIGVVSAGDQVGGVFVGTGGSVGMIPIQTHFGPSGRVSDGTGVCAFAQEGGTAVYAVAPAGYALQANGCVAVSTCGQVRIRKGGTEGREENVQVGDDFLVFATTTTPGAPPVKNAWAEDGRVTVTLQGRANRLTVADWVAIGRYTAGLDD